jgi:hypothetical protein
MKETTLTLGELLNHPEVTPFLREDDAEAIASRMEKRDEAPKDPIYIRILSGVGAWVASLFLIGFLGVSRIITEDAGAIVTGVILLATAVFLAKKCTSTFPSQLSLAFAFAGNVLVVGGLMQVLLHSHSSGNEILVLLLSHVVVCTTIYILYPSVVYRFAAPLACVIIATIWVSVEVKYFWVMHLLIAGEMLLLGVLLLHTRRSAFIQPLIRATATMLPATLFFMNLTQGALLDWHIWKAIPQNAMLPSTAMLAGGVIYLLSRLTGGPKQFRQPWLIVAMVATLVLGFFTTPGVLVAVGLLIAGYAFGDRALTALAYLFLPCFLVVFYYAMNVSLAQKSGMIAGSGLILLLVRLLIQRYAVKEVEA